ncbi:hypothetical protein HanRHA438_Chr17g0835141 [Helianthus annuus]|nr:hypothetical protein HanRHA438_Chr17g0835141 [Helianthus annuus]
MAEPRNAGFSWRSETSAMEKMNRQRALETNSDKTLFDFMYIEERKYCPLFRLWILIKNHMHGRGLIQMVTNLLLKCMQQVVHYVFTCGGRDTPSWLNSLN